MNHQQYDGYTVGAMAVHPGSIASAGVSAATSGPVGPHPSTTYSVQEALSYGRPAFYYVPVQTTPGMMPDGGVYGFNTQLSQPSHYKNNLVCGLCPYVALQKMELTEHLRTHQAPGGGYECALCDCEYLIRFSLHFIAVNFRHDIDNASISITAEFEVHWRTIS